MSSSVTREDVIAAAARIDEQVEHTPLIASHIGDVPIWLKCECLQTGGSFKLRGATNRLMQLSEDERRSGVVAFSSGNHAQGVAIAAKRLGIPATIVMPADAPAIKVDNTRSHGAEIVFYDRYKESREDISAKLAAERGAVVVPSFDDVDIVAGQGTVGLELLQQLSDLGEPAPLAIVVPVGGGGLCSGIALVCPDAQIIGAEPQRWDDMRRSLEAGEIMPVGPDAPATLCDALQTPRVSPITFGILQERNAQVLAVSEEEVANAVHWAWKHHQLTVEPGGAAALAAVLSGKAPARAGMVIVLSGGNIDPALHKRLTA